MTDRPTDKPYSETTEHWQSSHFEPLRLPQELVARIRYRITYQTARSSLRGWCGSYTLTETYLEAHDVVFDTSQHYEGQVVSPSRTYHPKVILWRGSALIIPVTEPGGEASELAGKVDETGETKPATRSQPTEPANGK